VAKVNVFPQLGTQAYGSLRDALRRSLPPKLTPVWVIGNVQGYASEASARQLLRTLQILGLVDENHHPTELLNEWRLDETYAGACQTIIARVYPEELAQLIAGGAATFDKVVSWMMQRAELGAGTAKNAARLAVVLATADPPEAPPKVAPSKTGAKRRAGHRARASTPTKPRKVDEGQRQADADYATEVQYLVGLGRRARLWLPPRVTREELQLLVDKLKADINLLAPEDPGAQDR
jgi:hypothetical protein